MSGAMLWVKLLRAVDQSKSGEVGEILKDPNCRLSIKTKVCEESCFGRDSSDSHIDCALARIPRVPVDGKHSAASSRQKRCNGHRPDALGRQCRPDSHQQRKSK